MNNTNTPKETKLLLIIPYWEGDKTKAEDVARLCANLISYPSSRVGVLMVSRFDASEPSDGLMKHLSSKFSFVKHWRCTRRGVGHPMGPNEIYYGTIQYLEDPASKLGEFEAVVFMESDCVFTRRDWHLELLDEWEKAKELGKTIVGAEIGHGFDGYPSHINAAAMYYRRIARVINLTGGPGDLGWDWHRGKDIVPHAMDSKLFRLDYRRETIPADELMAHTKSGVLMYHGVQDDSARRAIHDRVVNAPLVAPDMTIEEWSERNGYYIETDEKRELIVLRLTDSKEQVKPKEELHEEKLKDSFFDTTSIQRATDQLKETVIPLNPNAIPDIHTVVLPIDGEVTSQYGDAAQEGSQELSNPKRP